MPTSLNTTPSWLEKYTRRPPDPIEIGGLQWKTRLDPPDGFHDRAQWRVFADAHAHRQGTRYELDRPSLVLQAVYSVTLSGPPTQHILGYYAHKYRYAAVLQAVTWAYPVYSVDGLPWEIHAIEDDEVYLTALVAYRAAC